MKRKEERLRRKKRQIKSSKRNERMNGDGKLKRPSRFSKKFRGKTRPVRVGRPMYLRVKWIFGFILAFAAVLIFGLLHLYVVDGKRYSEEAMNIPLSDNTLLARRGEITDRNGVILAQTEIVYRLILDPAVLDEEVHLLKEQQEEQRKRLEKGKITDEEEKQKTEAFLKRDLYEDTKKFLVEHYEIDPQEMDRVMKERVSVTVRNPKTDKEETQSQKLQYYVLKKGISGSAISALIEEREKPDCKISRHGVYREEYSIRNYPFRELGCHVIGHLNEEGIAVNGIEATYDRALSGTNGRDVQYNEGGRRVSKRVEAVDGNRVVLSLDFGIQRKLEDKIKEYIGEHKPKDMAILVMNPANGEVLGMASTPMYDPNKPNDLGNFVPTEDDVYHNGSSKPLNKKMSELTTEEQGEVLARYHRNYAVGQAFEPGSTFKPVTFAAGLELKRFDMNTTYYCDGGEKFSNIFVACSKREGHGTLTAAQAIQESCNDALMQMGAQIGADEFLKYQHRFNFGRQTGIDLPNEIGGPAMLHTKGEMSAIDLATNAFGQNFTVNMMQLACADAALGNRGKYYRPYLCKEIRDKNDVIIKQTEPELQRRVVSSDVANDTKAAMRMVVEEGFMKDYGVIPGYEHQLFGKTGTAEKQPRSEGKYICSFIEMAPYEEPQVLVYVVIDEPSDPSVGTVQATHIATDLMRDILPLLGVPANAEAE